ncbi:putative holin-like toxin [Lactococcus lactis]|nr:putative holin-like toxin [Lactococcus lactis]MCT1190773.1 putative holin-like toxin [Lactococcus lactis]
MAKYRKRGDAYEYRYFPIKLERHKFLSVSDSLTLMIAFASFIVMLLNLIIVIVKSIKK